MKKFYFLAAMASVALASCVNEESVDYGLQESNKAIVFNSPVVSGMSRAVAGEQPVEGKYSTEENFRVYACWSNGDYDATKSTWTVAGGDLYMNNVEVTYDQTVNGWSSDAVNGGQIYYWPKTGKLTFAAYSPADVNSFTPTYDKTGLKVNAFTVAGNVADQYDFMFSDRSYNRTESENELTPDANHTGGSYEGVDILFHHALSSIQFVAKTDKAYGNTKINITGIEIQNAYEKANFAEGMTDAAGVQPKGTAKWSDWSSEKNYTIYEDETGQNLVDNADYAKVGTTALLIPQDLNHSGANNITVKIDYTIQNGSGPVLPQTASFVVGNGSYTESGALTGTHQKWQMGYRYTYRIIIGLNKIYFSPEVDLWKDVTITPDLTI